MVGIEQSYKDKIMFEIYKDRMYSEEYRVVYFSELNEHNKAFEIDRSMKGDHFFDGYILTLKEERAMKLNEDIIRRLNKGETLDSQHMKKQLQEFLVD